MMRFELGLEEPNPKRAIVSAFTIGGAYILGGFFPLAPYMVVGDGRQALTASVLITILALLAFGYVKGKITGTGAWQSAMRTATVGGLAALAAFLIARMVQ